MPTWAKNRVVLGRTTAPASLPAPLAEVVSDFAEVQGQDKLRLLLELPTSCPAPPSHLAESAAEPVPGAALRCF